MTTPAPPAPGWARRVVGSIFRVGWPRTDRARAQAMLSSFFLHLHAPRVRPHSLRASYTCGLGLVSAYLFGVLTCTGIVLMLYYTPWPAAAYRSVKDLQFVIPFGLVLRNLHRWAGHGMVLVVCLHLCRVFLTGAYKAPRQFNWQIGLMLLGLTLALSFTGYLLPWDQLAFWAITVGTSMAAYTPWIGSELRYLLLGGDTVGAGALLRFYVLHCAILPVLMLLLLVLHVFRVRRDGLSAPEESARGPSMHAPPPAPARLVPAWPHLLHREVLLLLATLVVLQVFALALDAPLEEIADPARTPNPARAPWYFLGLQELVHHSALVGGVLAPAAVVIALVLLPYVDTSPHGIGRWFPRERRAATCLFLALVAAVAVLTAIGAWFRGPHWTWTWPWGS